MFFCLYLLLYLSLSICLFVFLLLCLSLSISLSLPMLRSLNIYQSTVEDVQIFIFHFFSFNIQVSRVNDFLKSYKICLYFIHFLRTTLNLRSQTYILIYIFNLHFNLHLRYESIVVMRPTAATSQSSQPIKNHKT